jgi:predicted nucleic acid-binding protein
VRAVLDPNVLVSAAISPSGPPRQILTAWIQERFELIASRALLDELVDVLARPKFQRFITTAVAAEFIDGPADDNLIALARVAHADYLVSGDRHLLDLTGLDLPVLTPCQFLDLLETGS